MKLVNYSLNIGNKCLIEQTSVQFDSGVVNHLLGNNGVGKSCFAKSCIGVLPHKGKIASDSFPVLIGSYSNIPSDLTLNNIMYILKRRYRSDDIKYLSNLLNLSNISPNLKMRRLSDGQRQKIKLLFFLVAKPQTVILDEFTSALDKGSSIEMYGFLNKYVHTQHITCVNITHNLSDLENMPGSYFLLSQKKITRFDDKMKLVNLYIKGDY